MQTEQKIENSRTLLKKYYGYDSFRPGQEKVIKNIFEKRNTVVIMPTGGGKSLCYQLPSLLFEGVTIVISPLIALMKDQVDALKNLKIPATFINSSIPFGEVKTRLNEIKRGNIKLIYVAPERFYSQMFLQVMGELKVELFAIDEAHCISEWGHDFRPSYLQIKRAIEILGRPTIVALTATATPEVRNDIIRQLELANPEVIITGFDRPNLQYTIQKVEDKNKKLKEIVDNIGGIGIVYCGTRRTVEEVTEFLQNENINVGKYHAGMNDVDRKRVQEDFMDEKIQAVVATNAFGMGIDKPNVRFVVHYNMPGTIEAYYQEAGRAGRDGVRSYCVLLYGKGDRLLQEFFIDSANPSKELVVELYDFLFNLKGVNIGDVCNETVEIPIREISERLSQSPSELSVSSALKILEDAGCIKRLTAVDNLSRIKLIAGDDEPPELKTFTSKIDGRALVQKTVVENLWRIYGDEIVTREIALSLDDLAYRTNLMREQLLRGIHSLQSTGIIYYVPPFRGRGILLLGKRVQSEYLKIDFKKIEQERAREIEKLNRMESYVFTSDCRRNYILKYFGDNGVDGKCEKCDNCKNQRDFSGKDKALIKAILRCIIELNGKFGSIVISDILRGQLNRKIEIYKLNSLPSFGQLKGWNEKDIRELIEKLVADGYLLKSSGLYPTLQITLRGREFLGSKDIEDIKGPILTADSLGYVVHLGLFEKLRKLRKEIAQSINLPPFVVFHDRVLYQMASQLPQTKEEMLQINGVGEILFERYGKKFLQTIVEFCKFNPEVLKEKNILKSSKTVRKDSKNIGFTYLETYKLHQQGYDINQIAKMRKLSYGTIAQHLAELIEMGYEIDIKKFVNKDIYGKIVSAIKEVGFERLAPIKERLGNEIGYNEIKLVVAEYKKNAK
jgi:ATP-dependent DNA helicase RecQ